MGDISSGYRHGGYIKYFTNIKSYSCLYRYCLSKWSTFTYWQFAIIVKLAVPCGSGSGGGSGSSRWRSGSSSVVIYSGCGDGGGGSCSSSSSTLKTSFNPTLVTRWVCFRKYSLGHSNFVKHLRDSSSTMIFLCFHLVSPADYLPKYLP